MARSRDLKVGLFVLLGLVFGGAVIFLIGEERNLFASSVEFKTSFTDVQGLKAGAPVRLGGLDVGQVSSVGYNPNDPSDTTVYVTFWIKRSEAPRIRDDTHAKLANKGLLGDKMLELTVGSGDRLSPGSALVGDPPSDLMGQVGDMAGKADKVLDNVERATRPLADEKLHKDIQSSVAAVNTILTEIAHGDGYPNRLLTDKEEADRISNVIKNLEKTTDESTNLVKDVRGVVARVQYGPGFAHDVLYGDGPKGLAEFQSAANEVALMLRGVREGDSILHDVMYGGSKDGSQIVANLTDITGDIKAIVADVRAGKGTLGGLLVDPSIYEDVKIVLGNVQRNDVLRSLVRYSITQDQPKPEVTVAGPK
ncbi:MAG: MlaD family protein [Polyangiaceae bacterium]